MSAAEVLTMVERLGGSIGLDETPEGERIRVHPATILTPGLVASLRREKAALVALLRLLGSAAPADGPTATEIIAEVESMGAGLYLRPELGLVLYRGELIADELLLRLVRAHDQIEQIIRARYPHAPPEPEAALTTVAEPPGEEQIDGPRAALEYATSLPIFAEYQEPEPMLDVPVWYDPTLRALSRRYCGYAYCSACRMRLEGHEEAEALEAFEPHVRAEHMA